METNKLAPDLPRKLFAVVAERLKITTQPHSLSSHSLAMLDEIENLRSRLRATFFLVRVSHFMAITTPVSFPPATFL